MTTCRGLSADKREKAALIHRDPHSGQSLPITQTAFLTCICCELKQTSINRGATALDPKAILIYEDRPDTIEFIRQLDGGKIMIVEKN